MRAEVVNPSGCWNHSRPWRPRRLVVAVPVPVVTSSAG